MNTYFLAKKDFTVQLHPLWKNCYSTYATNRAVTCNKNVCKNSVRDGQFLDCLGKVWNCLQNSKRAHFVTINRLWLKSCQIDPKDSASSQTSSANENKSFEPKANDWMSGKLAGEGGGLSQKDPEGPQISTANLWVLDWNLLKLLSFSFNWKWMNGHNKRSSFTAKTLPYTSLFLLFCHSFWRYEMVMNPFASVGYTNII